MRKKFVVLKKLGMFVSCCLMLGSVFASGGRAGLQQVHNDLHDKASLQRGVKLYVNYCQGCHALELMRYKSMAQDLGMNNQDGQVLEALVQKNLNFVSDKITDPMKTAMPKKMAEGWFGVPPPDLTLAARVRGPNWIYSYLKGFYKDESRPWGVNNIVFPDVAMPHVLLELQGTQLPQYEMVRFEGESGELLEQKAIKHLTLETSGSMTEAEYDQAVTDLVNFLEYAGEPHKLERKRLGVWVILFLIIFTLFAYLLKREYWKDVH